MEYPSFIAIDASSYEDTAHPVAIAWSLADGTVKTTLVQPDDDWDDWDFALEDLHGISQDTLYQMGETGWSVIRELEADLDQPYLLADDAERCELLLEKLYEAYGKESSIEISACQAEPGLGSLGDWYEDTNFWHQPCDERIRLLLFKWNEFNNQK